MSISLTQLQAYNVVYKLLEDYYRKSEDEDTSNLLSGMLFLRDGKPVKSILWDDWLDAINNKETLTKQEAFDGLVRFFEIYHSIGPYPYTYRFLDEFHSAKDSDDTTIPLVEKWNHFFMEVLSEPEGTREYLSFGDPLENINRMQAFNTVYKLLDMYGREAQSKELVALAEGMLFLSDGATTLDSEARNYWRKILTDTLTLTKEKSFEVTILFLEEYGNGVSSSEALSIVSTLRSAKNSDDTNISLVKLWNDCLMESLSEPFGTINYLKNYKK